jgi:hypothetical protein
MLLFTCTKEQTNTNIDRLILFIFRDKRREGLRKEDFIIKNQKDSTLGRVPGTVNGQQFLIQNCEVRNASYIDRKKTLL